LEKQAFIRDLLKFANDIYNKGLERFPRDVELLNFQEWFFENDKKLLAKFQRHIQEV